MEISKERLKEIEDKAKAFFKGSYRYQPRQYKDDYHTYVLGADIIHESGMHLAFCHAQPTAEYFVAANPETVLALIARVRELEEELEIQKNDRAHYAECWYVENQANIRRKKEIKQLEKEANWLAKMQKSCNRSYMTEGVYSYCTRSYDDLKGGQTRCEVCWRNEARKAVEND